MKMKYKLKLDRNMFDNSKIGKVYSKKGYLQIDLMVSMLIFFFIVFLVFNFFNIFSDSSDESLVIQNLASDSRDLCFLLSSSSGYPNNWETNISNLGFIGLKEVDSNFLDSSKLAVFNSTNYLTILDNLNLSGFFKIDIVGLNSQTSYLSLGSSGGTSSSFSKSICYSNYNSEIVQIITEVWK